MKNERRLEPSPKRLWIPVSAEVPLYIRPLDEGGYELSLHLTRLPNFHAALRSEKRTRPNGLAIAAAEVLVAASESLLSEP